MRVVNDGRSVGEEDRAVARVDDLGAVCPYRWNWPVSSVQFARSGEEAMPQSLLPYLSQ